ncbi:PREDICTED: trihelix transcription factor GT-1-like [Vollenhovia emeryi]|uniref:trihelix transcription factor GT-1-like n=1 Tax=Vollenhovia emeryi TaxID=411798 RepID=UPI0005F460B8|nr:PREDICTED: trihelix transcription factor GT-1-like [Vollenhovia emeryi]
MDTTEENMLEQDQFENCRYQWTNTVTKLLIEEIRQHISMLTNKNSMQKKIWKEIASNFKKRGYNVTDEQCFVKWKNLKQKYKSVRDANNETGNAKVSWEYFDLMDEFMNTTPETAKKNVCIKESSESNDENTVPNTTSTSSTTSYGTTRNIRKRARQENELAYYEQLYKQREEHHKDNIEMQNRFLTLLKDIYKQNE